MFSGKFFVEEGEWISTLKRNDRPIFARIGSHGSTHVIYENIFWMESLDDFLLQRFHLFYISSVGDSKSGSKKIGPSLFNNIQHPLLKLLFPADFFKYLLLCHLLLAQEVPLYSFSVVFLALR